MSSVPHVAHTLQTVLEEVANRLARSSGFVKRHSKMNGALFVQTLVLTWLAQPQASLEQMAQTAALRGLRISPQGLEARFTKQAATFLQQVLEAALSCLVQAPAPSTGLLARFTGVSLFDSTSITLPACLADRWPGCGGRVAHASAAALKVQVVFDLVRGSLHGLLQPGRAQDRNAPTQEESLPAGALKIADLGYFSVKVLVRLHQEGVFFLSRVQTGTKIALESAFLDLVEIGRQLHQQKQTAADLSVRLGAGEQLPCRLLAVRVPERVAQQRRRKLRRAAKKRGQTLSVARAELADWSVFVTNVPAEKLTLDEALVLARARWQIELLFKLWKSHGQIDSFRTHKSWRILCEVYAKLLAQLVQHWLLLVSCWEYPDRSLVKAAQTVARLAFALTVALGCRQALEEVVRLLQRCLAGGCRMNKRKTKPNTCQLLVNPPPLGGLT